VLAERLARPGAGKPGRGHTSMVGPGRWSVENVDIGPLRGPR
jgi:hypothetical protein